MAFNLVLNSTNSISSTYKNQYRYSFLNSSFTINEDSEICVSSIQMPFSWFNLNSGLYNNCILQYYFPNGATRNLYTVTFPNGYYNTSDLQNYLIQFMISQNQYITNTTANTNTYFLQIATNATYYANQIFAFPVLTSLLTLPAGYSVPTAGFNNNSTTNTTSQPVGTNFFPNTSYTPQFVFPSSGGINSILGFSAASYPASSTNTLSYNTISNQTPNATPVNSVIVQCDLVNNECGFPSTVLDSFVPNVAFGYNVNYNSSYPKWIKIQSGTYQFLTIYFSDQNYNVIPMTDSNVMISLLLKQGHKKPLMEKKEQPRQMYIRPINFRNDEEEE